MGTVRPSNRLSVFTANLTPRPWLLRLQRVFESLAILRCRKALARAGGHKGKTCDLLGISRPTLTRKIKRYDLDDK